MKTLGVWCCWALVTFYTVTDGIAQNVTGRVYPKEIEVGAVLFYDVECFGAITSQSVSSVVKPVVGDSPDLARVWEIGSNMPLDRPFSKPFHSVSSVFAVMPTTTGILQLPPAVYLSREGKKLEASSTETVRIKPRASSDSTHLWKSHMGVTNCDVVLSDTLNHLVKNLFMIDREVSDSSDTQGYVLERYSLCLDEAKAAKLGVMTKQIHPTFELPPNYFDPEAFNSFVKFTLSTVGLSRRDISGHLWLETKLENLKAKQDYNNSTCRRQYYIWVTLELAKGGELSRRYGELTQRLSGPKDVEYITLLVSYIL